MLESLALRRRLGEVLCGTRRVAVGECAHPAEQDAKEVLLRASRRLERATASRALANARSGQPPNAETSIAARIIAVAKRGAAAPTATAPSISVLYASSGEPR